MRNDDDATLVSVAEAISDGLPVDWEKESAARQDLAGRLRNLRLVEEVAAAHRGSPALGARGEARTGEVLNVTRSIEPAPGAARSDGSPAAWGPLTILGRLGRGSFGEVYRAFDATLQREVALKLRRAEAKMEDRSEDADRFIQEARRLARIRHGNVLVVHGADRHDGRVGLWTDLLRGKNLEELLTEQGHFGAREAAAIGIDLCHALAAVHSAGLVHRDVKAANVMREQGGRIVLMDFGSVTERMPVVSPGQAPEALTGTPLYMPPEQILAGRAATPASDIYAVGVLLYRLVSGRYPIEAQSWNELIEKHRQGARVRLTDARPDLPAPFVQVVERALDADPGRRYQSAGDLAQALATAVGTGSVDGARETSDLTSIAWWRRAWAQGALAAGALVIVGAALVVPRLWPGSPLTAEASLYRLAGGAEERLRPGSRVAPGDQLFLEIRGQEAMYVYVLNEDRTGQMYVLFPSGLQPDNPLSPGVRHRLPGRRNGRHATWVITRVGGREDFLVIASRQPLKQLEQDLAQIPRADFGRQIAYAPVRQETIEGLRGIGGMAEAESMPEGPTGQRLLDIAHGLTAAASEKDAGIWSWLIELENPGQ